MEIAACNVRTVCSAGAVNELVKEMDNYRVDVCAVQEVSWPGIGTVIDINYMIIYKRFAFTHPRCAFHNDNRVIMTSNTTCFM
jgi:hypothetical protein